MAISKEWLNNDCPGNWRHLWGRTGQIAALGKVGYYGFTTSEETKKEPLF